MSYIFPYSAVGLSIGGTLTYATEQIAFVPICVSLAIALGLLRNANVKNGINTTNSFWSGAIKATAIYVFGPMIAVGVIITFFAICTKK